MTKNLFVNILSVDIRALNSLVNMLLSKKLTKAVMLEFNYCRSDQMDSRLELEKSEANSKLFLSKLYSKLSNRDSLNVSILNSQD